MEQLGVAAELPGDGGKHGAGGTTRRSTWSHTPMRALLIHPSLPESYWSLRKSLPIFGVRNWQPPLPLLTVADLDYLKERIDRAESGFVAWLGPSPATQSAASASEEDT